MTSEKELNREAVLMYSIGSIMDCPDASGLSTEDFIKRAKIQPKPDNTPQHNMKMILKHFELPEIYRKHKDYLVDDSILAYELISHIDKKRESIAIYDQLGSGKTFFTKLVEKLPEYPYLEAFQDRTEITTTESSQTDNTKQGVQYVTQNSNASKETIKELYSRTSILRLDLGTAATNIIKNATITSDLVEHCLVHYINIMVLKHIKDKTTQKNKNYTKVLQAQIKKNDDLKKSLYENIDGINREDVTHENENSKEKILKDLRIHYKNIAWKINDQIEMGNILSKSVEPPKNRISNFIIIMDDVNTMIGKTQHFISQEALESLRNNFLVKTIFLTMYEANTSEGLTSIQYIFCSIVPLYTIETPFVYPKLAEFGYFNRNNPNSFGEFSALRIARLICGDYDTDANNPSNASKLFQELIENKHKIKPFLETGLSGKELKFVDGIWKGILNQEKDYHSTLPFDNEAVREKEILQCSLSIFFVAIMGQPKFDVCKVKENVVYKLRQIYDIEVHIQNSTDNDEKVKLKFSIENDNAHDTKLNTRRILNFLMAADLKGSIYLRKSYRFSTELATVDFWNSFMELNLPITLETEFNMILELTDFESLFQNDVVSITKNEVKVAWFMYNAGYIKAGRLYKEGENKYVKLVWTNHQKRLSFMGERKFHILNKFYYSGKRSQSSTQIMTSYFLNETELEKNIKQVAAKMKGKRRSDFLRHAKTQNKTIKAPNDDIQGNDQRTVQQTQRDNDKKNSVDEKQFQEEFLIELKQILKNELKKHWPDSSEIELEETLYCEKEEKLPGKYIADGCLKSKMNKIDVFVHIDFANRVNDLYMLIELKTGKKGEAKNLGYLYGDNKMYHQIDKLHNKNVFYVYANLIDGNKTKKTNNDKKFTMDSNFKFLDYRTPKSNIGARGHK